jgi:hypothetical protein
MRPTEFDFEPLALLVAVGRILKTLMRGVSKETPEIDEGFHHRAAERATRRGFVRFSDA